MNTIQNLFQQAQLAEAAYANLTGMTTATSPDALKLALTTGDGKFSQAQAAAFAAQWRVVSQQPNTASGFFGTVFQNIATGEYVFAARGTEPTALFTDWSTNLGDIGSDGIAISQGLDLFNYYQRLIGVAGTAVAQYQYIPSPHPADPTEPPQMVRIADATATGELSAQPMLTSVGHSLGGHLAMILSRLTTHVGSVTTFNAPGFESIAGVTYPLTSEGFFNLLSAATGLTSMTNGWNTASMTHLDVQGDLVHIIGDTPGVSQSLFAETIDQGFVDAHLLPSMTDSLAVYNLFATLDPTLNDAPNGIQTITAVLKASSNVAANSLESAVAALGKLFQVSTASGFTGNEFDGTGRNNLYIATN